MVAEKDEKAKAGKPEPKKEEKPQAAPEQKPKPATTKPAAGHPKAVKPEQQKPKGEKAEPKQEAKPKQEKGAAKPKESNTTKPSQKDEKPGESNPKQGKEKKKAFLKESIHIVPLRNAFKHPKTSRAKYALREIKDYIRKHTRKEPVIDDSVNKAIWAKGIQHPPRRIRIKLQEEEGRAIAVLP